MERAPLRTIAKGFPGFPSNVDAVMVDGDGDIYAFKGSEYWLYFADLKRAIGPRDIEDMGIVPENVDAVVLRSDGRLVSFKRSNYYEWTSKGLSKKKQICDILEG